ncbi:MAG: hypothetical protein WCW45_03930, partial [Patescibacteria group bacterium]
PTGWETHQPPLYYVLGAGLMGVFHDFKAAQYMNTFILWLLIGMVGLGLKVVFKNTSQILLGMFAVAALPMLNIFPPMVTNELLNTFWIVSAVVALLYLLRSKENKHIVLSLIWITVSLILGFWTKISIITAIPTLMAGLAIVYLKNKPKRNQLIALSAVFVMITVVASLPVFRSGSKSEAPSNIASSVKKINVTARPVDFYFRLDWIPKMDMYTTQYYSLLGGAWNSFWTDGHNAVTPFVSFHKKSLILWLLGFILLPISMYGLMRLRKRDWSAAVVMYTLSASMLGMYVVYNFMSNHYSAVRLTYEMAIVVPYAFGIASAAENKKLMWVLSVLLGIQFIVLVSFFWILPWWHVTQ